MTRTISKDDKQEKFNSLLGDFHLYRGNRSIQLNMCELIETLYIDKAISRDEFRDAMEWIR